MTEEVKTIDVKLFEREVEKRQSAQAELVDLQKKLEIYSKFGEPEKIGALFTEVESLKKNPPNIDTKAIEESIRAEAANKIKELEEKLNGTSSELFEIKVVSKAWEQIGNEFEPDAFKLLKAELKSNLMLDEKGNLLVKGKDGKPVYKDGTTLMGVADLAETLKKEYPSLVKDPTIKGTMKGRIDTNGNNQGNGSGKIDLTKLGTLRNKQEAYDYFTSLNKRN
jgi:hypothetical protein